LEVSAASSLQGVVGFLVATLQIGKIGLTIAATNRFEMKRDVYCVLIVKHSQEKAAERLASRTTGPISPPDFTEGMDARIATTNDRGESFGLFWLSAQNGLNSREHFGRERFFEIGFQFRVGKRIRHVGHQLLYRDTCYHQSPFTSHSALNGRPVNPQELYSSGKTSSEIP
jgi:hypothetical protein